MHQALLRQTLLPNLCRLIVQKFSGNVLDFHVDVCVCVCVCARALTRVYAVFALVCLRVRTDVTRSGG